MDSLGPVAKAKAKTMLSQPAGEEDRPKNALRRAKHYLESVSTRVLEYRVHRSWHPMNEAFHCMFMRLRLPVPQMHQMNFKGPARPRLYIEPYQDP